MKCLGLLFKRATAASNFQPFERAFLAEKAEELGSATFSLLEARRAVQKFVDAPTKTDKENLLKKAEQEEVGRPSPQEMSDFFELAGAPLLCYTYAALADHVLEQEKGKLAAEKPSGAFDADNVAGGGSEPPVKRTRTNGVPEKGADNVVDITHQ